MRGEGGRYYFDQPIADFQMLRGDMTWALIAVLLLGYWAGKYRHIEIERSIICAIGATFVAFFALSDGYYWEIFPDPRSNYEWDIRLLGLTLNQLAGLILLVAGFGALFFRMKRPFTKNAPDVGFNSKPKCTADIWPKSKFCYVYLEAIEAPTMLQSIWCVKTNGDKRYLASCDLADHIADHVALFRSLEIAEGERLEIIIEAESWSDVGQIWVYGRSIMGQHWSSQCRIAVHSMD